MAPESNNNLETCPSYYRVQKRANVPSVRDFIIYFEIYFETTITSFHTYFNMLEKTFEYTLSRLDYETPVEQTAIAVVFS